FRLAGGTLQVSDTVQIDNIFVLSGGTLRGATVLSGAGAQAISVQGSAPTLDGVTLNADLTVPTNSTLFIANGLTLNGVLTLDNGFVFQPSRLAFNAGVQTLSGTGQI